MIKKFRDNNNKLPDYKSDYVAYFSTMITSIAFIPVFADMMINDIPDCMKSPTCSYSQKMFLASSNLFFYLFAGISISFMWLLLGKFRTSFFDRHTWINIALPPDDDSGAVSCIVITSIVVGLIFLSVLAFGISAPQTFQNLLLRIESRLFMIGIALPIMISASIIRYRELNILADFMMLIGLLYLFFLIVPS